MNASSPLSEPLRNPAHHPAKSYVSSVHQLDLACQADAMAGGRRGTYVAMVTTNQRSLAEIMPFQLSRDLPVVNTRVSKMSLLLVEDALLAQKCCGEHGGIKTVYSFIYVIYCKSCYYNDHFNLMSTMIGKLEYCTCAHKNKVSVAYHKEIL